MDKELAKLHKMWSKAKKKLDAASAEERAVRDEIDRFLKKNELLVGKVETDQLKITFKRNHNYSIPAAAITDIRDNIDKDTFKSLFYVNHRLKPGVYEKLTGKSKKIVKKHLTVSDAPLQVTINEK